MQINTNLTIIETTSKITDVSVKICDNEYFGRAIVQSVSRRLLTAAARVRARAEFWVCGGQSGTGAGFFRVLRFPLPTIPSVSPSSQSPGAGTIGPLGAAVTNGPNRTPLPLY
jgi:hypothetical protein